MLQWAAALSRSNDDVWGINASGNVYRFNYSTKVFNQVQGVLKQITVGLGDQDNCHPYEVWGINSSQNVFRYNYCTNKFDTDYGAS